MSFSIKLQVGNLPSNRLALTNKIYISNSAHAQIAAVYQQHGVKDVGGSGSGSAHLVLLNGNLPYAVEGHGDIVDGQVALNGLQRRYARLSIAAPVSLTPLLPTPAPLASLQFSVDTLSKTKTDPKSNKPREMDTNRLQQTVLLILEGQVLKTGQTMAIDFEGTKLELAVTSVVSLQDLQGPATMKKKKKKKDGTIVEVNVPIPASERSASSTPTTDMGQFLGPTEVVFRRAEGCTSIMLTGDYVADGGGGGGQAPTIFLNDFDFVKLGIGGLDAEFNRIFRRAFASRVWPAAIIQQMGISHVRGMLLHGPPGCGKTLIARQIGKALNSREPKIVNGPEILNKYVGGSEEKIRELFADAEKEQAEMGDASMLHIVIMDEMDAICKQRGTVKDGTGVSDSVVNQLLSKIDGVDSLNNILLIGMTNRKDMIDDALLRPGRLEVHVEIGLPDEKGRLQILDIHTRNMRKAKRITDEVLEKLPEIAEQCKNFRYVYSTTRQSKQTNKQASKQCVSIIIHPTFDCTSRYKC
jgi:vesicle-fusing ATPase